MEPDASQLVSQRLAELPADVRNAVQAADLGDKVRAIGARYALHIDQTGELEDETLLAMLGFSPMETFDARIADALHVPLETGNKLAADVSADIFSPIRESMKGFLAQRQRAAAPVAAPSTPPAMSQKPPISPDLHKADIMLTEKTASLPAQGLPPVTPAKDTQTPIYKTDPYREPV